METEQEQPTTTASSTSSSIPVPVVDEPKKDKGETLKLALNYLVQGKRHLLVKDISSSIVSLGEACQLLAEANGPLCADNAEAHFYYGKALLEQSRLDLSVFHDGGVPADKEGDESEEEEESEEDGEKGDGDKNGEEQAPSAAKNDKKETEDEDDSNTETEQMEEEDNTKVVDEDLSTPSPVAVPTIASDAPSSSSTTTTTLIQDNQEPSTSSGIKATENGADKEGEDEPSNLEVAWEVLEIAKLGYDAQFKLAVAQLENVNDEEMVKSKTKTKLHLQKRLSETHSLLGEVATESENYPQAVEDFKTAIEILTEIEGQDSREVAQYYFQLGLAYSFAKEFQLAIESFKKSKDIIELRISNLQAKIDNKQTVKDLGVELDDPSYTEDVEIAELKAVLPELDEKVADTIDAERESKASIAEENQEREIALKNSPVKNPNPPAINDISHLVKKKKKAEEPAIDVPPAKRVCIESSVSSNSKLEEVKSTTTTNGHENGNGESEPKKSEMEVE